MINLRKIAWITVFFIIIFMGIALLRFQRAEEGVLNFPERLEYHSNEGWRMSSIRSGSFSYDELKDKKKIPKLVQNAYAKGQYEDVDLPFEGESDPGDLIIFKYTLPQNYAGLTLTFPSQKSSVCVVLDGTVIYEYGMKEGLTSQKAPESNMNFMDLPNTMEDGELYLAFTSPLANQAAKLTDVKAETRDTVVLEVVGNNIGDIGCCLLMVIMAFIMLALALIRRYTHQPGRGEIFIGLVGLLAGIYCFIGTDTLDIFYNIQEAYEMQEYLMLMIPLFFAIYFERNLHTLYPRRFSVLLFCTISNAFIQILLHILHIQDLANMINVTALAIGVICVVAAISLIKYDYVNKSYQAALSILSLIILLAGGIGNVIVNIFYRDGYSNAAGQYSMAVFSVMMAVMHVFQLSKEYRASAEENACLLEKKVKEAEQQNMQLALAKKDADTARQEALAANDAKGRFLAHMSHEIRTPINAVLGMDEMILRESKEQNVREYAMDIYTAGQTLLSLINDILDFSKIESGKMEIIPVEYDISSMIHDLMNMTSQRAKEKNIKLEVEVDHAISSRLYGDDVRLRQILTNILTNAVKYTPEGTIWLRVNSREKGDISLLSFEVEDTGIGIKAEDLPKLSAEFERIEEDRNRNIEGTGLGMSITNQLLALLGSRLHVESVYGKGSKFSFQIEQKIIDHTPIGDFESRVRQLAEDYDYNTRFCAPDAKILVVDDNAVNRKVLRNLLKETHIQVSEAEGGVQCLELVQQNHYDLIFLDHMMPNMDGVETLHHMQQFSDYPCQDTPVVVLTANAVSGAKENYLKEGFDDFLAKPVAPEKLERMIQKLLPPELLQESLGSVTKAGKVQEDAEHFLQELPPVDGLDWDYAWQHLPDQELLEYTVKEFYAQIDSAADQLEHAYERLAEPEQLELYRIQVHAMKSLAATVGIMPLSGVARLLEFSARDGNIERILSMTEPFLEEWRSYRQKLRGVFGIETQEKQAVSDYSVIQAFVEMVRISMAQMDIDGADQAMDQLKAYEYPKQIAQGMQKLAEAVTNLDAEEAERLAGQLIAQLEQKQGSA